MALQCTVASEMLTPRALTPIINQHALEAALLWEQRRAAISAPQFALHSLAKLDDRIAAHINGLQIAGGAGWAECESQLATGDAGELFVAAVLALDTRHPKHIEDLLSLAEATAELQAGLISAFGWVSPQNSQNTLKELLTSNSPYHRRVGIAGLAINRINPGRALVDAIIDSDPVLRARAMRAAGELGRRDLVPLLRMSLADKDEACRFWSAWSGATLGDAAALPVLLGEVTRNGPFSARALPVLLRRMDVSAARDFLSELFGNESLARLLLNGAGYLGDPYFADALIEVMAVPELARVAGEAFTLMTGADIPDGSLEGEPPVDFQSGPNDDPDDEDVAPDPDEDLPWPNQEKVKRWWHKKKSEFQEGKRYLLGKPIDEENAQRVLRVGRQRQRIAAALELSIMNPGKPLFETRAPGFRQKKLLGIK